MGTIKTLYIEDNDVKFSDVCTSLGANNGDGSLAMRRAANFIEAAELLKSQHFDLVILDIRIPYAKGRAPQSEASEDVVSLISNGETFSPSFIIGLTEYPEEIDKNGNYPIEYFTVEKYSLSDRSWVNKLKRHIAHIVSSKDASLSYHYNSYGYDLLLICARAENEFKVVDNMIRWEGGTRRISSLFSANTCVAGVWNTSGGMALKVALLCLERTGLSSAAAITSAGIAYFRPRVVSMLGMCCGINPPGGTDPQALGDVIVMSETFCWDEGRYSERVSAQEDITFFEARPSAGNMTTALRKSAEQMIERDRPALEKRLAEAYAEISLTNPILEAGKQVPTKPKVRMGLNVSGSSVVAAKEQTAEITTRFPGALGLEMECHAIYSACYLAPGVAPEAVCIKGVADFGDGRKSKEYQRLATVGSFIVLEELLDRRDRSAWRI